MQKGPVGALDPENAGGAATVVCPLCLGLLVLEFGSQGNAGMPSTIPLPGTPICCCRILASIG